MVARNKCSPSHVPEPEGVKRVISKMTRTPPQPSELVALLGMLSIATPEFIEHPTPILFPVRRAFPSDSCGSACHRDG
jgi:hypothetical protein